MTSRYLHLEIDSPMAPPSAAELVALEDALGVPLPADFLAFLNVANGGRLDYSIDLPVPEDRRAICFYNLYSTRPPRPGRASPGRMLFELEGERTHKGVAREMLPFASDDGSSVLFLDLTREGGGRVVAFIEGLEGWSGQGFQSSLVTLGTSFEDFARQLYLNMEEEPFHSQ